MPAWSPDGERIVALRSATHEHGAKDTDLYGMTNTDVVWIPGAGGETNVILPARGGSALGAARVLTAEDLPGAMIGCFAYGDTALVERCIAGTEITVGVFDHGRGPEALPAVEILPVGGAYDYAARYPTGQTEFYTPARLPADVAAAAADAAITAHNVLGLRDLSRTDLIVADGQVFFLEVNVAPGMTETSTLPMALEAAGLDLGVACRDLLCLAAARGN